LTIGWWRLCEEAQQKAKTGIHTQGPQASDTDSSPQRDDQRSSAQLLNATTVRYSAPDPDEAADEPLWDDKDCHDIDDAWSDDSAS